MPSGVGRLVQDIRAVELHALYFTGKRQKRKVANGYGIVTAVVDT